MVFAGIPLALGISIFAFTRAIDRPFAIAALAMSGLEAMLLATAVVLSMSM